MVGITFAKSILPLRNLAYYFFSILHTISPVPCIPLSSVPSMPLSLVTYSGPCILLLQYLAYYYFSTLYKPTTSSVSCILVLQYFVYYLLSTLHITYSVYYILLFQYLAYYFFLPVSWQTIQMAVITRNTIIAPIPIRT